MNDEELKRLFKSMDHGHPSEVEIANWKKTVRRQLIDRTPSEWGRLAAACLIGFAIGAAAFRGGRSGDDPNNSDSMTNDATIERVYVNDR